MAKQFLDDIPVKPQRQRDRKKHHKTGYNEGKDLHSERFNRINFKKYMRELDEQAILEAALDLEEDDSDQQS